MKDKLALRVTETFWRNWQVVLAGLLVLTCLSACAPQMSRVEAVNTTVTAAQRKSDPTARWISVDGQVPKAIGEKMESAHVVLVTMGADPKEDKFGQGTVIRKTITEVEVVTNRHVVVDAFGNLRGPQINVSTTGVRYGVVTRPERIYLHRDPKKDLAVLQFRTPSLGSLAEGLVPLGVGEQEASKNPLGYCATRRGIDDPVIVWATTFEDQKLYYDVDRTDGGTASLLLWKLHVSGPMAPGGSGGGCLGRRGDNLAWVLTSSTPRPDGPAYATGISAKDLGEMVFARN